MQQDRETGQQPAGRTGEASAPDRGGHTPTQPGSGPQADACDQALQQSFRYLSYRARSRAELQDYLAGKGHPPSVREAALARLEELEMVDDLAFARAWVENRERFRPRSARALRHELRHKGVADEVIDRVLEDFDSLSSARRALEQGVHRFGSLDPREREEKLRAYLARRGYPYPVAQQAIRQVAREGTGRSATQTGAAAGD